MFRHDNIRRHDEGLGVYKDMWIHQNMTAAEAD